MNRNMTSTITVLLLVVLSGCATTSTPELVEQAQLTGDWTAVDARFEALDQTEGQSKQLCPIGTKQWCFKRHDKESKNSCSCVDKSVVRDRLVSLLGH